MKRRIRLLAAAVCLAAWQVACGGSGGGSITPNPTPTITSVSVSPTTATVATSKTATFTAAVTGTGNYSTSVTWSASDGATISPSGVLTAPSSAGTVTITATSSEDSTKKGTATVTVVLPVSVSAAAMSPTVNAGGTDSLSATVMNGDGKATVTWSVAGSPVGSLSPTTGLATTYTAPAAVASTANVSITATATDSTGTASSTITVTVERVITISVPPNAPIPNHELYLDFGVLLFEEFSCSGCEAGDTLNIKEAIGGDTTTTFGSGFSNPWEEVFNFTGPEYVPGPILMWITGTDGAKSNTLWLAFDGSENVATEDPSSGEIYYYNSGNGTDGSGAIMKFKPDGTEDGNLSGAPSGSAAIAFDSQTVFLTQPAPPSSGANGIATYSSTNGSGTLIPLTNGEPLAIGAKGGLVCVTIPTGGVSPNSTDAVDCNNSGGTFTIPGIPAGSEPTPIKVIDSSHIVFPGRGDQTLRWYAISGTAATASGTLQLSEFTPADANYWKTYPATGGWEIVQVGSTLGVMGQVVNSDGTVSQKLALVNNTNQTLIQYVDLPAGAVHIAADPTNNAVVAEYVDFSGSSPILRFERIYVDTGNTVLLQSTSTLVPGAGFLVTNDGSHIAVFVEGKADFEPNQ